MMFVTPIGHTLKQLHQQHFECVSIVQMLKLKMIWKSNEKEFSFKQKIRFFFRKINSFCYPKQSKPLAYHKFNIVQTVTSHERTQSME